MIIEDVYESRGELDSAHQKAVHNGALLPPPLVWSHREAASPAPGAKPAAGGRSTLTKLEAIEWAGDEVLVLDCLDRNAPTLEPPPNRSAFVALGLLCHLRSRADAGQPIPRTVVYSRGLADATLRRAVLAEFTRPREAIANDRPSVAYRSVLEPPRGFQPVLGGMYEYSDVLDDLAGVVLGSRPGLQAPNLGSAVYREAGPRSCLASFHEQLRSGRARTLTPKEWSELVIDGGEVHGAAASGLRRRVSDAASEFLDPTDRGGTWRTWLSLLRAIARP